MQYIRDIGQCALAGATLAWGGLTLADKLDIYTLHILQGQAPSQVEQVTEPRVAEPAPQIEMFPAVLQAPVPSYSTLEDALESVCKFSYKASDLSQDDDVVLLARVMYGEGRGVSQLERAVMGQSALNRVNDGKKWNGEDSLYNVVVESEDFDALTQGRTSSGNFRSVLDPQAHEPEAFAECLFLAYHLVNGNIDVPFDGVTVYVHEDLNRKWVRNGLQNGTLREVDVPENFEHRYFTEHIVYK